MQSSCIHASSNRLPPLMSLVACNYSMCHPSSVSRSQTRWMLDSFWFERGSIIGAASSVLSGHGGWRITIIQPNNRVRRQSFEAMEDRGNLIGCPRLGNCGRAMIIGAGWPITIENLDTILGSVDHIHVFYYSSLLSLSLPAKHTHYTENGTLMIGCMPRMEPQAPY